MHPYFLTMHPCFRQERVHFFFEIAVVMISDSYYVFTTFDGINLPRFAYFEIICSEKTRNDIEL